MLRMKLPHFSETNAAFLALPDTRVSASEISDAAANSSIYSNHVIYSLYNSPATMQTRTARIQRRLGCLQTPAKTSPQRRQTTEQSQQLNESRVIHSRACARRDNTEAGAASASSMFYLRLERRCVRRGLLGAQH